MADDTDYSRTEHSYVLTAQAAVNVAALWQLANGRAAAFQGRTAASSGDTSLPFTTTGKFVCPKQTGVKLLDGGKAYWDRSARVITYKPNNDRDFFVGTIVGDAESAAATCTVNLNVEPVYTWDLLKNAPVSVLVGTPAAGGFGYPVLLGGSHVLELSSTSEVQKVDLFAADGFDKDANCIVEGAFRVYSKGAGSAPDFSIGLASATHASDADSIAESLFLHLNGNDANIYVESDDGTNEVNATDTTVDFTEGTANSVRVEFWIDMRVPTSVKWFINGVAVNTGTTFNVSAGTGPLKPLIHLEKTSAADVFKVAIDWLQVRIAEQ